MNLTDREAYSVAVICQGGDQNPRKVAGIASGGLKPTLQKARCSSVSAVATILGPLLGGGPE